MTHRSRLDRANEIASLRQLQLQRALAEAARAQSSTDQAHVREVQAADARNAHFDAWRDAVGSASGLSPALLDNFARALVPIAAEHNDAHKQAQECQTELNTARLVLAQRDRLADLAHEHALHAAKRYRQALDEKRMTDLEIRTTHSMEGR